MGELTMRRNALSKKGVPVGFMTPRNPLVRPYHCAVTLFNDVAAQAVVEAWKALHVIVQTPAIRAHLQSTDPRALAQADRAVGWEPFGDEARSPITRGESPVAVESTVPDQAFCLRSEGREVWKAIVGGQVIPAEFNSLGAAQAAIPVEQARARPTALNG